MQTVVTLTKKISRLTRNSLLHFVEKTQSRAKTGPITEMAALDIFAAPSRVLAAKLIETRFRAAMMKVKNSSPDICRLSQV